jgi:hypothetical protein
MVILNSVILLSLPQIGFLLRLNLCDFIPVDDVLVRWIFGANHAGVMPF